MIGILFLALAAGCAGLPQEEAEAPPDALTQIGSPLVDPSMNGPDRAVAAEPPRSETEIEKSAAMPLPDTRPRLPVTTGDEAIATEPLAAAPRPPMAPMAPSSAAHTAPPPAKAHAKVPAVALAIEQSRKTEDPRPAAKTMEPPLDVAALKARLRDTDAIGLFTKLALRNQVDDLLKQFRAHYLNGQTTSVASLRQPYDMLVLKVLALVQDSDPPLARTISGSREAIWGILADPEKFKSST